MTEDIPKGYKRVEGSQRKPAREAHLIGPASPDENVLVTIRIRRRLDAPALPDQKDWTPKLQGQRKLLSHEEFSAKYGSSPDDMKIVEEFAKSNDLEVIESNSVRRTVKISGTVKQMNSAFGVKLGRYKSPAETYRGREGHIHLPNKVADVVEGVFGLDNRRMARRASVPAGASALTPPQVAGLYNFPTSNANGQTIGLLEFGGGYQVDSHDNPTDIQAFFNGLHLTTPNITDISIDSANNNAGSDTQSDVEVALDIDVAGSVAQGATIAVYFAPWTEQGWIDAVTTAIHPAAGQPAPSVISISWGWPENETIKGLTWTQNAIDAVSATFQEAAALGITIFVASGDDGSNAQIGDGKAHVLYPASDPWVTACGGTIIKNVSGSTFTEDTWNDFSGATGGGISDIFPLPTWQSAANIPASINDGKHQGRGVPDVAGNASEFSGYNIQADGNTYQVGGTSAVAPLYAGLIALINAKMEISVGYLNPVLYFLAGTNVFRDIDDGVSNSFKHAPGYTSGPGWDACTGLGSLDGTALLAAIIRLRSLPWLHLLLT